MKWNELKKKIGPKWNHATVCIQERIGESRAATRVSLHENDTGGLLIVLHEDELQRGKPPAEKKAAAQPEGADR